MSSYIKALSGVNVPRPRASCRLEVQQLEPRNAPGNALPFLSGLWGLSPLWWGEPGLLSEFGIMDPPRESSAQQSRSPATTLAPGNSAPLDDAAAAQGRSADTTELASLLGKPSPAADAVELHTVLNGHETPPGIRGGPTFEVVMSGLDNPRGLAFGPEGGLYVAESGRGGDGPCIEIRPGETVCYGPSGAVSRLWHGQQERVAAGLASFANAAGSATGPQDISFHGRGGAYVTVGLGADPTRRSELGEVGADFGQLVRLRPNGDWRNSADVAAYEVAANPDGGPLDSNPFGVLAEAGGRVVVDAGGNALVRVAANGDVSTLAVFPSRPHGRPTDAVPTNVAVGPDGAYYVGELTGVPFAVGVARIYRVAPGQEPQVHLEGFSFVIDIAFGPDDSLYVLQHATGPGLSGDGALIRVAPDGTRTTLASEGLIRPTSVLVGDDGAIYVSNRGTFVATGEVIRITP